MIEHMFDRVNWFRRRSKHRSACDPARSGMMTDVTSATAVRLRPLTARSAILSLLLGTHPPSLSGSELVAFGLSVAIKESAVRAALTRMVASGDLHRDNGTYTLSARLLERQHRQDEAIQVPTAPWDGAWRVAVVVSSGKDQASRLHLRRTMIASHFGELREGVWMRPDNLPWQPADDIADDLALMSARPLSNATQLAEQLFDASRWATAGRELLTYAQRAQTPRDRLTAFAAIVRHLTHDPLLPTELLPRDWPGGELRAAYDGFREEVLEYRRSL